MEAILATLLLAGLLQCSLAFSSLKYASGRGPAVLFARKPLITGNWKLNPRTREEAIDLAAEIAANTMDSDVDVGLFVPFPFVEAVKEVVGDNLFVGAQVSFPESKGAFTGAISPSMLQSVGADWVLAGHSERRTIFGETNEDVNAQCRTLIENGLNVVLCIGESEAEFDKNLVHAVCQMQLKKGLAGVSADNMASVTIAYEPVWAIGTGKVATPEIAQGVHAICRKILRDMYGRRVARNTRILYGGSVGPESVDDLMAQIDIDGALVGGASLDGAKFGRIINFVPSKESTGRFSRAKQKTLSTYDKIKQKARSGYSRIKPQALSGYSKIKEKVLTGYNVAKETASSNYSKAKERLSKLLAR